MTNRTDKAKNADLMAKIRHDSEALLELLERAAGRRKSFSVNYFVHRLLSLYRTVAVIWCVEDVLSERPDLSDEEAWRVLQQAQNGHDAEIGLNWQSLRHAADELFGTTTQKDTTAIEELVCDYWQKKRPRSEAGSQARFNG